MFREPWNDKELEILKENYPTMPMDELLDLLSDRSKKAICRQAERCNIKRSNWPRGENSHKWRGGKITHKCQYCGKIFRDYPSHGVGKYCSYKCARVAMIGKKHPSWQGGPIIKICDHCKKSYTIKRHEEKRSRFCSRKCADEYGRISIVCENCGKKFSTTRHEVKRRGRRFCSNKCAKIFMKLENHPRWNGGSSFEPYPQMFNREFKRMIRERDNYTCAICGKRGKCVHHINYVKDDICPTNCITLCRSCHSKTNVNREYWQELFRAIMLKVAS